MLFVQELLTDQVFFFYRLAPFTSYLIFHLYNIHYLLTNCFFFNIKNSYYQTITRSCKMLVNPVTNLLSQLLPCPV